MSPAKSRSSNVTAIRRGLAETYPDATCALVHRNAFELLVATILSAQCTDARVNAVTPTLFARYPNARALAAADLTEVESLVRSTGFYRNKAKNIVGMAQALVSRHAGEVPKSMAALVELPGVARKTANVVLGTWFGEAAGVVVDTHVRRLSNLLGLSRAEDPVDIEQDLMRLIPREDWTPFAHRLIHHGRQVCIARKPRCGACSIASACPSRRSG